ncbi:hypothetical protein C0J52_09133 [Blattella germanica]|nr:hypothetical protein C0J52_09133 [Blattella germanica]
MCFDLPAMGLRRLFVVSTVICCYFAIVAASLHKNDSLAASSGTAIEEPRSHKDHDDDDEHDYKKGSRSFSWFFLVLGCVVGFGSFIAVCVVCHRCAMCPLYMRRQQKNKNKTTTRVVAAGPPAHAQQPEVPYYNALPEQRWQPPPYSPQAPVQQVGAPYYETVPPPQFQQYPRDNAANCPIYETPDYQKMNRPT